MRARAGRECPDAASPPRYCQGCAWCAGRYVPVGALVSRLGGVRNYHVVELTRAACDAATPVCNNNIEHH